MSKVLQHIINKFIAEQFSKSETNNTKKPTDPICAMIKQTDSQNTIQVGAPGTNQPGGQIQAQTALSSEKAIAKQNGAIDAFIIVTCLQTGNKYDASYIKTLITKLFKNYNQNIPWISSYATPDYFCLLPSLTTTIDDSMVIPVWIYSKSYKAWRNLSNDIIDINVGKTKSGEQRSIHISNTKRTPKEPIELMQTMYNLLNKTFIVKPQIDPTHKKEKDIKYDLTEYEFKFETDLPTVYKLIMDMIKSNSTFASDSKTITATKLTYEDIEEKFKSFYKQIKQTIKQLRINAPWMQYLDVNQIKMALTTEVFKRLPTFPSVLSPAEGDTRPLPLIYLSDMESTYKIVPGQFKNIQKQLRLQ